MPAIHTLRTEFREGSPLVVWGRPTTASQRVLLLADVISYDLVIIDRTTPSPPSATGTITIDALPVAGNWVKVSDGTNAPHFFQFGGASLSPYHTSILALGVDAAACAATLAASLHAEFLAGRSMLDATAAGAVVSLFATSPASFIDFPKLEKAGNDISISGLHRGCFYSRLEAPGYEIMFATLQTAADDAGWEGGAPGFSMRLETNDTDQPFDGTHTYRVELTLHTAADGDISLVVLAECLALSGS